MAQDIVGLEEVGRFTNQELIMRLRALVRSDQALTARLVVHLGEVDARGLYREHAYSSLLGYCVQALGMSEAQAYLRIHAARLGRRFPRVVQLLALGALHLTAVRLLGPHLTADNHLQLLERARGKGKRQIERLVAEIAPKPDVPSRIRKLPEISCARPAVAPCVVSDAQGLLAAVEAKPALSDLDARIRSSRADARQALDASPAAVESTREPSAVSALPQDGGSMRAQAIGVPALALAVDVQAGQLHGAGTPIEALRPFTLESPRQRSSSKPLSPGRYKVEFTAGQALHDKLEQLQALLRHQVPDGELAIIVERALDMLLDHTLKRRFARTKPKAKTRASTKQRAVTRDATRQKPNSRYIPRAVVRAVHQRDGGQCTFVSSDGRRCAERSLLEMHHHDVTYARGGKATVGNLRLVCRAHNALYAERDYGTGFMRSRSRPALEAVDTLGPDPSLP
jgi:hypothetical protein